MLIISFNLLTTILKVQQKVVWVQDSFKYILVYTYDDAIQHHERVSYRILLA